MSQIRKITTAALAAIAITASFVATTGSADAFGRGLRGHGFGHHHHHRGHGFGHGMIGIGALAVGSAIAAQTYGPRNYVTVERVVVVPPKKKKRPVVVEGGNAGPGQVATVSYGSTPE